MVVPFHTFWRKLNIAFTVRSEPEALYGEARDWYDWTRANRPARVGEVDESLVNRAINARKPL